MSHHGRRKTLLILPLLALLFALGGGNLYAAVQIKEFVTRAEPGQIVVEWSTVEELENQGFIVTRRHGADGPRERMTLELIPTASLSGEGAAYSWVDRSVVAGEEYHYWLHTVSSHGTTEQFGPVSVTARMVPTAVTLSDLQAVPGDTSARVAALGLGLLLLPLAARRLRPVHRQIV